MYYLQSRYYNSELGRFINTDGLVGVTGELLTHNMFAYCLNNPVNMIDPSGFLCTSATDGISDGDDEETPIVYAGLNKPLFDNWNYRIDNTNQGKHIHVFNDRESEGSWSQRENGGSHDEGNNSPGDPPKSVKKKLKQKIGWDWDKKKKEYEGKSGDTKKAVIAGVGITGGAYVTYRVVRLLPSLLPPLLPPLWPTLGPNLVIP